MKRFLFLVPLLALASISSVNGVVEANANVRESSISLKKYYDYGSEFKAPTLIKDGVLYDSVIEFPDGGATHENMIVLRQSGTYTIHYSAEKGGRHLYEKHSFVVKNSKYTISGDKGFANFEKSERTYGKEGLFVSLAEGETITFNQAIDLRNSKQANMAFSLFASPSNLRSCDFQSFYITLTDVEDPSSYITIRCLQSTDDHDYSYVAAASPGMPYVGQQYINGIIKTHINNEFGYPAIHSFYGDYPAQGISAGDGKIKIHYDAAKNAIYANETMFFSICDFDDPSMFPTPWAGFKSGKAILSVRCDNYIAEMANFVVDSIKGCDLSDAVLEDVEAPNITINSPYDLDKLPLGLAGESYPVFDASAYDEISKDVKVKAHVHYHYDNDEKTYLINVENGMFKTAKKGIYDIVYEASDSVGNIATKILSVSVVDYPIPILITPTSEIVKTIKKGQVYKLPTFDISGGSGSLKGEYKITLNGLPSETNKGTFIPKDTGIYKVRYIATDILGQKESYEYNLEVIENSGAVFYDQPDLPKYLISGSSYLLPSIEAIDYGDGEKSSPAEIEYEVGGVKHSAAGGSYFVPSVESEDEVKITYKYKDALLEYAIPCINVYEMIGAARSLKIQKYFSSDNVTFNTDHFNYSDVIATSNGDFGWEFINPILSEGFSLRFAAVDGASFKELDIMLSDSYDWENQRIKLRLVQENDGKLYAKIGGESIYVDGSLNKASSYTISYSDGFILVNNTIIALEAYENGEGFEGFASNKVYVSMVGKDAKAGDEYMLQYIDNQAISETAFDSIEPRILLIGDRGGYRELGETFSTNIAYAGDVLDPFVELDVRVEGPDKAAVKDVNGVSINHISADKAYEFKLEQYGNYKITYTAKDSYDNTRTTSYVVFVTRDLTPEIKITSNYKTEIALGEAIIIPDYVVTSQSETIDASTYVTVRSPKGSITIIPNGANSFMPKYVGEYVISIYAIDDDGNVSTFKYSVNVVEKEGN